MGLFRRISSVFSSPSPSSATAVAATVPAPAATIIEPKQNGSYHHGSSTVSVMDPPQDQAHTDEPIDLDDSGEFPPPAQPRALAPRAPRNKQELFEELQKNYTEVVELVRKVDGHLDREQHRSARVMEVIDRFDAIIPTLQSRPRELNDTARELNETLISAIRESDGSNAKQIAEAVTQVELQLQTSGKSQAELVHTMAAFRETIGRLATSNEQSDELLRSVTLRNDEREQELSKLVSSSRRSMMVVTACAVSLGLVGIAIGAIALFMA
ncbi:MAG: hypothetical protein AAGB34_11575 [Planctomycetota bacterium]